MRNLEDSGESTGRWGHCRRIGHCRRMGTPPPRRPGCPAEARCPPRSPTHRHAVRKLLCRQAQAVVLGLQPPALCLQHLALQVLFCKVQGLG